MFTNNPSSIIIYDGERYAEVNAVITYPDNPAASMFDDRIHSLLSAAMDKKYDEDHPLMVDDIVDCFEFLGKWVEMTNKLIRSNNPEWEDGAYASTSISVYGKTVWNDDGTMNKDYKLSDVYSR